MCLLRRIGRGDLRDRCGWGRRATSCVCHRGGIRPHAASNEALIATSSARPHYPNTGRTRSKRRICAVSRASRRFGTALPPAQRQARNSRVLAHRAFAAMVAAATGCPAIASRKARPHGCRADIVGCEPGATLRRLPNVGGSPIRPMLASVVNGGAGSPRVIDCDVGAAAPYRPRPYQCCSQAAHHGRERPAQCRVRATSPNPPITDRRELVDYIAGGSKPRADWRIGTEHEKFGFRLDDLRPPAYDGERGIEALLTGLTRSAGNRWRSTASIIALARRRLGHAGAGRPVRTLRRAAREHPRDLRRNRQPPRRGQDGRARN